MAKLGGCGLPEERVILATTGVHKDTLIPYQAMADMEHKNYLKHDVQVFRANKRPWGMYYIHLRNNARIRRDRWIRLMVDNIDTGLQYEYE
jgi:hypothetical protein